MQITRAETKSDPVGLDLVEWRVDLTGLSRADTEM